MRCSVVHESTGEQCVHEEGHAGAHRLPAEHRCHARHCTAIVPPVMLMCLKHWRMVPQDMQRAVKMNYRRGQCDDKRPSKEWQVAASAAIDFVAKKEGLV